MPRSPAARDGSSARRDRLCVENRAGSANLAEAQAFMDDEKRILVFSDAGGTGRSYHADLAARNRRLRVHYLLEAGWKADTAIQGLGRTQPHQPGAAAAVPADCDQRQGREALPVHDRPPARHARAPSPRGQRQTGGQGLFRADDNLESGYGRAALRQLYVLLYARQGRGLLAAGLRGCDRAQLTDNDGSLREDLPPITTFLNRLLALTIDLQNTLFGVFEELLHAQDRRRDRLRHL